MGSYVPRMDRRRRQSDAQPSTKHAVGPVAQCINQRQNRDSDVESLTTTPPTIADVISTKENAIVRHEHILIYFRLHDISYKGRFVCESDCKKVHPFWL